MDNIRVTSNLSKTLKGRYDGKDYIFEPKKPVVLSLDAARHIFDLGKEDKSQCLNQLGLTWPFGPTYAEALAQYDKIVFDVGRVTFDPETESETDTEAPA